MSEKENKTDKKDLIEDLKNSANKIWLAGLGALSMTDKEGTNYFKNLVQKGQDFEKLSIDKIKQLTDILKESLAEKVKETKSKAETVWEKIEGKIDGTKIKAETILEKIDNKLDERVATVLKRFGVPDGDEIAKIANRIDELSGTIDQLKKEIKEQEKKSVTDSEQSDI